MGTQRPEIFAAFGKKVWLFGQQLWSVRRIPGTRDKYHILSYKGEPLYRPADNVVWPFLRSNRRTLMALVSQGQDVDAFVSATPENAAKVAWSLTPADTP